jgi:hypothetical protein
MPTPASESKKINDSGTMTSKQESEFEKQYVRTICAQLWIQMPANKINFDKLFNIYLWMP